MIKACCNLGSQVQITFREWSKKIVENFEKYFWVNSKSDPPNEPRPDLINQRGIYKDSVGATQVWADYQLRPNFPVAMVVVSTLSEFLILLQFKIFVVDKICNYNGNLKYFSLLEYTSLALTI